MLLTIHYLAGEVGCEGLSGGEPRLRAWFAELAGGRLGLGLLGVISVKWR